MLDGREVCLYMISLSLSLGIAEKKSRCSLGNALLSVQHMKPIFVVGNYTDTCI